MRKVTIITNLLLFLLSAPLWAQTPTGSVALVAPSAPLPTVPLPASTGPTAPAAPAASTGPTTPPPALPIEKGQPVLAEKKAWIENMQRGLPGLLCQDDHYFVKCFEVSHQQCVDFTKLLVEGCLNNANLTLPQNLDSQQREYWGQMIGRCSYDLYERFMLPKKRTLPQCTSKTDSDLPKPVGTPPIP